MTRNSEKVKEIRLMWKILLFTLGGLLGFKCWHQVAQKFRYQILTLDGNNRIFFLILEN